MFRTVVESLDGRKEKECWPGHYCGNTEQHAPTSGLLSRQHDTNIGERVYTLRELPAAVNRCFCCTRGRVRGGASCTWLPRRAAPAGTVVLHGKVRQERLFARRIRPVCPLCIPALPPGTFFLSTEHSGPEPWTFAHKRTLPGADLTRTPTLQKSAESPEPVCAHECGSRAPGSPLKGF